MKHRPPDAARWLPLAGMKRCRLCGEWLWLYQWRCWACHYDFTLLDG